MILFEPGGVLGKKVAAVFLTAEKLLTKRGAVVRAVDFLGDEQEGAVGVDFPDRLGGATAGKAAAYEEIFHMEIVHTSTFAAVLHAAIIGLFSGRASPDTCKYDTKFGAIGVGNYLKRVRGFQAPGKHGRTHLLVIWAGGHGGSMEG